ncbi:hypothetical protein H0A36_00985 [Endozoicomonas sp. SM1973]|uniref:Thiol:disulfide interchange protein DsbD N-terminal domain-containing protein n=1 Tax=Spartinivicinus marinus TaxID=2994442 RepID=A0A853I3M7_9GAMM|nr:hypothetical protein [Spartinivicinus marinus]MCX4026727.1 hypothetical protein [Spartinivicinus marinus]NYZ64561.1 hypothetical protein [Spartinivicinus marinus]
MKLKQAVCGLSLILAAQVFAASQTTVQLEIPKDWKVDIPPVKEELTSTNAKKVWVALEESTFVEIEQPNTDVMFVIGLLAKANLPIKAKDPLSFQQETIKIEHKTPLSGPTSIKLDNVPFSTFNVKVKGAKQKVFFESHYIGFVGDHILQIYTSCLSIQACAPANKAIAQLKIN